MLLRYATLSRKPAIFKTMTGLTVALFDDLVWDLGPSYGAADYERKERPGRQRAGGGGRQCRLGVRDEFLLTVVWLRHYFTQEALGYFFGVSDTTGLRVIARALPVREAAGRDTMRQPPPSRRARLGVAEALRAYPELADLDDESRVVDSWEQRTQRPTDHQEADDHYSGKKKAHTLKSQIVVQLGTGSVREVSPSVPGPVADPPLLRDSRVRERLGPDHRALGDLGYYGTDKDRKPGTTPRVVTPRRKPRGKERPPEDVAFNQTFARARIVVAHSIRDIRIYQALSQVDRHRRKDHERRVCAVVGLRARRCRPGRRDQLRAAAISSGPPRSAPGRVTAQDGEGAGCPSTYSEDELVCTSHPTRMARCSRAWRAATAPRSTRCMGATRQWPRGWRGASWVSRGWRRMRCRRRSWRCGARLRATTPRAAASGPGC